jgi:tRNA threonylcarbamoyl adenosine modification protein YeaZ
MLTFILETSTEKGLLVLAEDGTPIAVKALPGGPELSKCLALEVKNLLKKRVPELIAVGTGPGSYTGIRVGAALAKALAYGWNIPLLGFCSLKAFGPLPVLVDARGAGVYFLNAKCKMQNAELLPISSPILQNLPVISSPHPEWIKKRLSSGAVWHETEPDPKWLTELVYRQFLEEGTAPLELTYLCCP